MTRMQSPLDLNLAFHALADPTRRAIFERLCRDGEHAARVADLTVYLRQSHAERDLQHLGALAAAQ